MFQHSAEIISDIFTFSKVFTGFSYVLFKVGGLDAPARPFVFQDFSRAFTERNSDSVFKVFGSELSSTISFPSGIEVCIVFSGVCFFLYQFSLFLVLNVEIRGVFPRLFVDQSVGFVKCCIQPAKTRASNSFVIVAVAR